MKNFKLSAFIVASVISCSLFGQDTTKNKNASVRKPDYFYTFAYNQVPENYNHPVIGVMNIGDGNHKGFQLGFANLNQKNFRGTQMGFTNAIGGTGKGDRKS